MPRQTERSELRPRRTERSELCLRQNQDKGDGFHQALSRRANRAKRATPPAKRVTWVAVLAFIGVAGFLYLRSDAFGLKQVAVEGNTVVTDAQIQSLLPMGENLFSLDTDEIVQRLSRHPYLAQVQIDKVYPDKLVVRVIERTPACYLAEGPLQLLAGNGTVLPMYGESEAGRGDGAVFDLPVVTGYEVVRKGELEPYEDAVILAACGLCAEMQRQALPLYDELVEIRPHTDHLEGLLADGTRVLFPLETAPSTLAALQAVYTRERQGGLTELDARYERQIISRYRTG
ncbi:MAG: FtsQ-type POTRA domain-containing protein [bacterium]|nr:FtsQ-type POTRA domain-containing protein [bacterium]